jgi:NAD(P)-dependent dehydrogenase (short-subunit alcohol dehydrogenase family)
LPIDLRNKPIAITGAGTGIGRATALACAKEGMPVVLAGRRLEPLDKVADEIRAAGGKAVTIACDVAKPEDCRAMVDLCVREFGSIYSVFANAGYGIESSIRDMPDAAIRAMFETNFFGTLNTIRPALDAMISPGVPPPGNPQESPRPPRPLGGHVLICSSCLSKLGMPFYAAYSATKACQDHFARAMRTELRPLGVYVSSVHPVGTKTDFFETTAKNSEHMDVVDPRDTRFMQPASTVARHIVRCLRSPRGEVWTQFGARWLFGMASAMPAITDLALRGVLKRRAQRRADK